MKDWNVVIEELTEARYKYDNKVGKIKGVSGLSKSDVDTVILYVESYRDYGSRLVGLMTPRGKVAEVLAKYGIEFK